MTLVLTQMLPQRVGAETAATIDPLINTPFYSTLVDIESNPGTDGCAVGLCPHESNHDPMIAKARIFEECIAETITGIRSTQLGKNILVAIVV